MKNVLILLIMLFVALTISKHEISGKSAGEYQLANRIVWRGRQSTID
jgi:hypothetical protein